MTLPKEWKKQPFCTDIVDLPLSMAAMDHLDPIMYRANFRRNPSTGEKGLRKVKFDPQVIQRNPYIGERGLLEPQMGEEVLEGTLILWFVRIQILIAIATGDLDVEFTLEESAERVYVAMMQVSLIH